MIKSMTAFGRADKTVENNTYEVEIRSLNNRYLEITARTPPSLYSLEERVRKLVSAKISRGRVHVAVRLNETATAIPLIEVNYPLAEAYNKALGELARRLEMDGKVGLDTLLRLEGIVHTTEPDVDADKAWEVLSACIGEALEGVNEMRLSEGRAIYNDFIRRLAVLEDGLGRISQLAQSLQGQYLARLKERIVALTEGTVDLDPSRLAQEAAMLADKSDITEEIVRAQSHLKQFRTMIESEAPAGRALDFLLQEINREINTIGSKGNDAQLSQMVIELKSEAEKIREQVQNVE